MEEVRQCPKGGHCLATRASGWSRKGPRLFPRSSLSRCCYTWKRNTAQGGPRPGTRLRAAQTGRRALEEWLAWASRSRLLHFVRVARTIREHREGILTYLRYRLTNGVVEGFASAWLVRSRLRVPRPQPLIAMLILCCGESRFIHRSLDPPAVIDPPVSMSANPFCGGGTGNPLRARNSASTAGTAISISIFGPST